MKMGIVKAIKVSTKDNAVDMLTKSLSIPNSKIR